jgi:hypothetical protein
MRAQVLRRCRLLASNPPTCTCTRFASPSRTVLRTQLAQAPRRYFAKRTQEEDKAPNARSAKRNVLRNSPAESELLPDEVLRLQELLSQPAPPDDEVVVEQLRKCKEIALRLQDAAANETQQPETSSRASARNLLKLDETKRAPSSAKDRGIDRLSEILYKFVQDPKIFLSPRVLALYVQTQSALRRPESFPEIFNLYATKPMPMRGSAPVRYKNISPNRMASAIPLRTASEALDAAMESRILPLCLDVIGASVCTPAYRRRKLVQKMWVPTAVIAFTPPIAWLLALSFDQWQITLTSRYARTMAFAGFASYVGFTGILGYVALTTANDQMERVTWRDGLPLTTRWLREDERAMMDRVAMAWGFKDRHRRGEEEGPEWEALRELVSMRDMVLDRVELMDGFE